ncbi:MAG TPA: CHASE3 domain-containing protein [Verrucomicrobiae bacterium]|jgi:CHASE3 domain sensor protein
MSPTSKKKKILFWLGLALPLIALIAMTWLVHKSAGRFNNSFTWVMQSYKVLDLFEQTQSHIVDAEANQRGYLLTGRKEYLDPYHSAMAAVRDNLSELQRITKTDPEQQANIAALEQLVADELEFDPVKAFANGQTPADASVMKLTEQGKKKIEDTRRVLYAAREEQEHALAHHQQQAEDDVISSQLMSLVLIVAVAVALGLVVIILLRLEKLQQFVTVCAWTGRVKHHGQWLRLDEYLKNQFDISVSHTLSQEAAEKMRIEIEDLNRPEDRPSPPQK